MKLKNKLLSAGLICSSFMMGSCSHFNKRTISSQADDVSYLLNSFPLENSIKGPTFCRENFSKLYEDLFNLSSNLAIKYNYQKEELDELIEKSFLLRLKMKENIDTFHKDPECFKKVADANRSLRYLEDYKKNASGKKASTESTSH